jgi:hypothetical protein
MLILPQSYNDEDISTTSSVLNISNSGNIRQDACTSKIVDGESVVEKSSRFGTMISPSTALFSDAFKVEINKRSGEVIDYGSISRWPIGISDSYFHFGARFDEECNGAIYRPTDITKIPNSYVNMNAHVENNLAFPYLVDSYENDFQLSYINSIGALLSLFSTLNQSVPYTMVVTLDSKKGFNITQLNVSKNINKSDFIASMKNNIIVISEITNLFMKECTLENRNIIGFICLHPFGVNIRCKDTDHNLQFMYNTNLSDHIRILQTNDYYEGKNYGKSTLLHSLLELGKPSVLDSLGSVVSENDGGY